MDLTTTSATAAAVTGDATKPEPESDTPTRIQPIKPLSFTNGVLKRTQPQHNYHLNITASAVPAVVTYKECLKNHAATLGGHALDGCGEFMPSPSATATDPTSLKCAACGCHRNFHRREPEESPLPTTHVVEYQPLHRHHPPPPPRGCRSPNSASPPPISSAYYPSAPHMLLALSAGIQAQPENASLAATTPPSLASRKRFRTKFSSQQKEKMHEFAERVGWKMQKRDEDLVAEFCNEVGVDRGVLKVWMHNNKNTSGKRDANGSTTANGVDNNGNNENIANRSYVHTSVAHVATANGSSSSS